MRAAPSPSAPVTARLRINTWVRIARTEGDYFEVVLRAGGSPARGFVERRFVVNQSRLDVDPVLETARKEAAAGRPLEALTWAERAFAVDGSSEAALDLLEKTARDAGRPERAEPARRLRTGQAPITFGVCARAGMDTDFFQLVVVAKLSSKGELSPVAPGEGAHLASEAWFVVRPSVPGARGEPFYGTPTVRPRSLSHMHGEGTLLSLGEACKPGEVWATAPLKEVRRSGLNAAALGGARDLPQGRIHAMTSGGASFSTRSRRRPCSTESRSKASSSAGGRTGHACTASRDSTRSPSGRSSALADGCCSVWAGCPTAARTFSRLSGRRPPSVRRGASDSCSRSPKPERRPTATFSSSSSTRRQREDASRAPLGRRLLNAVRLTPRPVRVTSAVCRAADRCPSGLRSTVGSRV